MAPPYNTIPAAADEQDSLLAKKDTTKLKRLVAGAAVASSSRRRVEETFVQSFTFASGNCIKDYGSKTLHYVGDGQGC